MSSVKLLILGIDCMDYDKFKKYRKAMPFLNDTILKMLKEDKNEEKKA